MHGTVYVYGGYYSDNIVIAKSIDLIGDSKYTTTIHGDDFWESGVEIDDTKWVNLSGFTIKNIGNGLTVVGSEHITIFETTIENGIFMSALYLCVTSNSTISRNTITSKVGGIYGILLTDASWNTICENFIEDNLYGIYHHSESSHDNIVYHNNFINNTVSAYDYGDNNVWYNAMLQEGNYWDDHIELYQPLTKYHPDSTWDVPYEISENGVDLYPLIEPWN